MAEQELPAATVSKLSNLQSEPMDGLKIPPKGSTLNFKSNRHRLTLHQLSKDEIKPLGDENHRCRHSSNKVFLKKIKSICEERCQEKYRRKKKRKRRKNGDQTATEKGQMSHGRRHPWPMVAPWPKVASPIVTGDHGCMVADGHKDLGRQILPGNPLFRVFFTF
ncbi:hypothetical protein AAC387_Pa01g2415 [Persea americana]